MWVSISASSEAVLKANVTTDAAGDVLSSMAIYRKLEEVCEFAVML